MAVPEEIRRIERPKNTFVIDSKTGVYSVREKVGCKYHVDENGKIHRPSLNGKVVGHIIDGKYVPNEEKNADIPPLGEVDLKDYANVYLCDMLSKDLLESLKARYTKDDALRIYIMAILRACYDSIKDYMLDRQYQETFLTEMYPAVNLDKSSVSRFLRNLGRSGHTIVQFMRCEVSKCQDDDIFIFDGTLKRNHSIVNTLSADSRKTVAQKYRHVNVMTAYSYNRKEQVASKAYPGNMVDQRIVVDFMDMRDIKKALVVADRGFPPEAVRAALKGRPGVDYLTPLSRDRKRIEDLALRDFIGILPGTDIAFKTLKGKDENGKDVYYYSFRDPHIAADEESHYNINHTGLELDLEDYERSKKRFGTIVFESSRKMDPALVREIYGDRWLIETSFKFERSELGDDTTDEESDYTVQASQFIDHLASVMASRMKNRMEASGLLENHSYEEAYSLLLRLKMTREYNKKQWKLRRIAEKDAEVSVVLGILQRPIVPIPEKGKRGRPKGSKDSRPRKKRGKATGHGLKDPSLPLVQ